MIILSHVFVHFYFFLEQRILLIQLSFLVLVARPFTLWLMHLTSRRRWHLSILIILVFTTQRLSANGEEDSTPKRITLGPLVLTMSSYEFGITTWHTAKLDLIRRQRTVLFWYSPGRGVRLLCHWVRHVQLRKWQRSLRRSLPNGSIDDVPLATVHFVVWRCSNH